MITARGEQNEILALRKLGFTDYLTRPIKQSKLHELLNAAFPAKASVTAAGRTEESQPSSATARIRRVLVVEDHPVNQLLMMKLLQRGGFATDIAASGQHALSLLACDDYDLVLMDIQMPEMNGYECTRRIRMGEHHAGIPIIAMTANAMKGDREKCLAAGMNDYISKPIQAAELYDKLRRWTAEKMTI